MEATSVRICTLGTFTVKRRDEIVEDFLTRKTALLFTYMAMNPGEHTREKLASLLWSETTDEQALKNLRTVLSSLRRTVPEAVNIERKTVQTLDTVWIDACAFESACDAIFSGEKPPLEEMLALADLYSGEFLRDLAIRHAEDLEVWIGHKRDELHQKYLQLLYHIVETCLNEGTFYVGIDVARQLVMLNPLWEAAQRQLMLLLVNLGQNGEAQIQFERVRQLLDTELGVAPEDATITLYEQIKIGNIQTQATRSRTSIVLPDLPFVSPVDDLKYLREMLDKPDCRLITLTGIGGCGKSMLATHVAHEYQDCYRDGVVIVPLTHIQEADDLPGAILESLNISVSGTDLADRLVSALKDRHTLLVLDNYEQLLPNTDLVARILDEASGVKLLITSQIALSLRQEWLVPMTGFKVGGDVDNGAMQLFKLTAQRIIPNFDPRPHLEAIMAICNFLEGLPLGIVIAAGQLKYLSPPEILAMLHNDMLSMSAPYQDIPERHRGFSSLVNSIMAHLSDDEQQALTALSIFPGSFDHRAALAVAGMPMGVFIGLVDKCLVQPVQNFRYTIHNLLKVVFRANLQRSATRDEIRKRLTDYYINWCRDLYHNQLIKRYDLDTIEVENANIWHLDLLNDAEQQDYILQIIPTMQQYWKNRGYTERVATVLHKAVDNLNFPAKLRARGMIELGMLAWTDDEYDLSQELCLRAIQTAPQSLYIRVKSLQIRAAIARRRGNNEESRNLHNEVTTLESLRDQEDDPNMEALFIGNHVGLGVTAIQLGDSEAARAHWYMAMTGWAQFGDPLQQAQVQSNIAMLDLREGKYHSARDNLLAILPLLHETNHDSILMVVISNLARAQTKLGEYCEAYDNLTIAMESAIRLNRRYSILTQMETFTHLAYLIGQYPIATQLHGFLLEMSKRETIAFSSYAVTQMQVYSDAMRTDLGDRYESLIDMGRQMDVMSASRMALSLRAYLSNQ